MNGCRPKLTERITLRLPLELLDDLQTVAINNGKSLNDACLNAIERDMILSHAYQYNYYVDIRMVLPIQERRQVVLKMGQETTI